MNTSSQAKIDYYTWAKKKLTDHEFTVNPYREISYGLQFMVFWKEWDALVRVYDGKKGIRLDLSQVHHAELATKIQSVLDHFPGSSLQKFKRTLNPSSQTPALALLEDCIGIDESGKGDYFGPLVVAAVAINAKTKLTLKKWGVCDSKQVSDAFIQRLAPKIKALCPHSVIIMENSSYNTIYKKIKNLNHMLAWGHVRTLENTLLQVDCPYAISDKFGNPDIITRILQVKKKNVILYQEHHAEQYIAVAAASIVARDGFVSAIQALETRYQLDFPKGCSIETLQAAKAFVDHYGRDQLHHVAKLHFKVTEQLFGQQLPL